MNTLSTNNPAPAGVDVSQETLDVAVRDHRGNERTAQFDNTVTGHRQLIGWLTKRGKPARVVLEGTGVYSLDLAVALHAAKRIEVMVVNPRAARQFADACLQRSNTDATMAVDETVAHSGKRSLKFTNGTTFGAHVYDTL